MHRTAALRSASCLVPVVLAACTAPMTQIGSVSNLDVRNEQFKQQQMVIESQFAIQHRLDNVAYPLLKAAIPLCGQHVAAVSGVTFANLSSFSNDFQTAAQMAGFTDTVAVVNVVKGGPADRAGITKGDRVLDIVGAPVAPGKNAMGDINKRFAASFSAHPVRKEDRLATSGGVAFAFPATSLPVTVRRDTTVLSMTVPMDTTCGYQVVAVRSDELNAWADGQKVYVTSAMMRFTDDAELATVVSHELGHDAMHHMDAKKKNAMLGGLFGAVLDVAMATQGVNTGGRYTNDMAAAGAQTFSQDFEREADYVGMYILARAGEDYSHAANVWRHMATENPGSIKMASSHPTSAERFVRLEHTSAEIDQKKAAGQPLMPEMKAK